MNSTGPRHGHADPDEPAGDAVLAGEYVLGVLDAADRRRVQARIAADAGFAVLVDDWERQLAHLAEEIAPAEAPPQLWPRIRTQLGWSPMAQAPHRPWQAVGFWRGATALAAAAAVAAIVIGRFPQPAAPPAPPAVSQATEADLARPVTPLVSQDGKPGWLASVNPARGTVLMVPVPAPADAAGRVPELWLIAPGEAPRSLGLVSIDKAHTVAVPTALRRALAVGSTLAITLEPPGGAPRGVATGPIVASGDILTI